MSDETIKPAFSAEEWRHLRHPMNDSQYDSLYYQHAGSQADAAFAVMAKANDALPDGDRRKLARVHVDALDAVLAEWEPVYDHTTDTPRVESGVRALRAILAALLPEDGGHQPSPSAS